MPRRTRSHAESVSEESDMSAGTHEDSDEDLMPVRVTRRSTVIQRPAFKRKPDSRISGSDSDPDQSGKGPPEKKGRGKKVLNDQSNANNKRDCDIPMDFPLWAVTEKRATPQTNYDETSSRCPLPGCDSRGHLSGRNATHRTLTACPLYHNTTADECKRRFDDRQKNTEERKKIVAVLNDRRDLRRQIQTDEQKAKFDRIRSLRRKHVDLLDDEKEKHHKHREKYNTTRQPLLNGLASEYDLKLFKEAQAKASEKMDPPMHSQRKCVIKVT